MTEIGEGVHRESDYRRLEALYRMRAEANKACTSARGRPEFIESVVRILAAGGYVVAWIGLLQEDGTIALTATAGKAREYAEGLHLTPDPAAAEGRGPAGIALRTGRPYVCNDFLNDAVTKHWHERARRYGIAASFVCPLRVGGDVVGILTVYADHAGQFGARDVDLLEDLAHDVSAGLEWIAQAEALRLADARLRTALQSLTEIERATRSGSVRISLPSRNFWCSQGVTELLGLERTPDLDAFVASVSPATRELLEGATRAAVARDEPLQMDVPLHRTDGSRHWIELFVTPARRADGTVELSGLVRDIDERKRLESAVAEAASRERARIGADLHDELGQVLTSLGMFAHAISKRAQQGADARLRDDLRKLEEIIGRARTGCRALSHEYVGRVSPDALESRLAQLADEVADPVQCHVRANAPFPAWLTPVMADELYSIAREAVANALKHSRGSAISIELDADARRLTLVVDDDGIGMQPGAQPGVGLANIRARAARIGGYARFERSPRGGLRVEVIVIPQ